MTMGTSFSNADFSLDLMKLMNTWNTEKLPKDEDESISNTTRRFKCCIHNRILVDRFHHNAEMNTNQSKTMKGSRTVGSSS